MERNYFSQNFSLLLSSGMNVSAVLDILMRESKGHQRAVLEKIKSQIDEGGNLSEALARAKILPAYAVSLVKLGEQTGTLAENLRVISQREQKEQILRSKIRSAMIYPLLVFGLTVLIGTGIAWFILPRLANVFANLRISLPVLTRWLISFASFLSDHGFWAVPSFLLAIFLLIYFVFFFPITRGVGQRIMFHLPVIGKLVREIEISRFGYIFGTLLKSGMPILDATLLLNEVSAFYAYKEFYGFLHKKFQEGFSFEKIFGLYPKIKKIFPATVRELIISGEQSGKLPDILLLVAENFEQKTEETAKNLTVLLEPLLLFVVWAGVVLVALAVILPIYSLLGGINK